MIRTLLDGNLRFVAEVFGKDRDYFTDLSQGAEPDRAVDRRLRLGGGRLSSAIMHSSQLWTVAVQAAASHED